jgi:hypothetical protein
MWICTASWLIQRQRVDGITKHDHPDSSGAFMSRGTDCDNACEAGTEVTASYIAIFMRPLSYALRISALWRDNFWGVPSIATMFSIVFIFIFSFCTQLHVSALMGHHQVKYTQSLNGSDYAYNGSVSGYTVYTYISYSFLLCCTLFLHLKLKWPIMY